MNYEYSQLPVFIPTADQEQHPDSVPVLIVGAGPVGLAMAIDLAQQGIQSVVVDSKTQVSVGSRAICWAKRTLEIFDRLGVGDQMVEKRRDVESRAPF